MGAKKKQICRCTKNRITNKKKCEATCGSFVGKDCNTVADCKPAVSNTELFSNDPLPIESSKRYFVNYQPVNQDGGKPKGLPLGKDVLSNWKYQEGKQLKNSSVVREGPVYYYDILTEKYGEPNIRVNKRHGLCIWIINDENDPHSRLELKDEYVGHCVPAEHYDFFYSYVNVYIPPESLATVLSISGSVGYDPLKHEAYARCGSLEANFATLATLFNVLNNTSGVDYSKNIKARKEEYEDNKKFVLENVKANQEFYKEELTWPYYPGAFQDGCPK